MATDYGQAIQCLSTVMLNNCCAFPFDDIDGWQGECYLHCFLQVRLSWCCGHNSRLICLVQVTDYELVIEGYVNLANLCKKNSEVKRDLPLSWVNNLKERKFELDSSSSLSLFVVFNMKQARVLNHTIHSNEHFIAGSQKMQHMPCLIEALTVGMTRFDLGFVVHKYPLRCKPCAMNTEISELKFSVEVIRLPFSLYISHGTQGQSGCSAPIGSENPFVACVASVLSQSRRNHGNIRSLSKVINLDGKEQDAAVTYIDVDCLMKEENTIQMKRLLFQSTTSCVGRYEFIQIGNCYLIEPLVGSSVMHVGCQFWSLIPIIDCAENGRMKVQVSTCPLVDVVLEVPIPLHVSFNSALKEAERYLSPIMSVKDVLNVRKLPGYCHTPAESKLAAGSLVSFSGVVKSFHSNDLRTFPKISACRKSSTSETLSISLDVKDMDRLDLIKVTCSFDMHVFPLGLGAGSVITVHRALLQWPTMGNVMVQSLPSTLIVVSTIKEENFVPWHENLINYKVNNEDQNHQQEPTELTMISEIEYDPAITLVKLHCRVLAVERLLLGLQDSLDEPMENSRKLDRFKRLKLMEETCYRVTYASFVLDDGTGLASCWAKGDTAACLLNLPNAERRSTSSAYQTEVTDYKDTFVQLNALVRKYGTIWMQNIDPELDFPSDNVFVQGGKDKDLSLEEKRFFYGIVKQACHAGPMEIVAEFQKPENADVQPYVTRMNFEIDMAGTGSGSTRNELLLRKAKPLKHELYLKDLIKDLSVTFQTMGSASADVCISPPRIDDNLNTDAS